MAFDPSKLALAVDTIGGGSLRIHFYETTDIHDVVISDGYFTDGGKYGLRENDIILVSEEGQANYIVRMTSPTTATFDAQFLAPASQAEAEAGVSNIVGMTPLRTLQQITANLATESEAEAGTANNRLMTPLRTDQFISAYIPPGGTAENPGLPIGTENSGFAQLYADSISVIPGAFMDLSDPEHHGVLFTKRGSIAIGSRTTTGAERLPNQSALEICYTNNGASGLALTIGEWNSAGAANEPVIFYRSRGENIGDLACVQKNDAVGKFQYQVDNGFGDANLTIGNFQCQVDNVDFTPISGNIKTIPGVFVWSLTPGDGTSGVLTSMKLSSAGHLTVERGDAIIFADVLSQTGRFIVGSQTIIEADGRVITPGHRGFRSAINAASSNADIYSFKPAGGATCIIHMLATQAQSATIPWGAFGVRLSSDTENPFNISLTPAAISASNIVFQTGAITDYTTCTDGKWTISSCTADGKVYIVNRTSTGRTYAFDVIHNS